MRKIYFLSTIMLIMMAAVWPLNAEAQNDVSVWDGFAESWTQGDGTENNPYLIENAQNLAYLAQQVNAPDNHTSEPQEIYADTWFTLTTDLDLGGDNGLLWTPIGKTDRINGNVIWSAFAGHFDGGLHTIYNMLVEHPEDDTMKYEYAFGLFGFVVNGSVKNIILASNCSINIEVFDHYYTIHAGGILGWGINVDLENCVNRAPVKVVIDQNHDGINCGGIAGVVYIGSSIKNCHNFGDIYCKGDSFSGGLRPAGIVANATGTDIYGCSNRGNITCINTYFSLNESRAGGIAGCLRGDCNVEMCCNTGEIRVNDEMWKSCGGIVGGSYTMAYSTNISIKNCYSVADVSAITEHPDKGSHAGGIFGYAYGSWEEPVQYTLSIENCYAVGSIVSDTVGGIFPPGEWLNIYTSELPIVTNSYYINTIESMNEYGMPLSEDYMKSEDFVNALNVDETVFMMDLSNENNGYPVFANKSPLFYEENNVNSEISVYPNPAQDHVKLEFSDGSDCQSIEIYSIDGRLVDTRHGTSLQNNTIDISSLNAGMYVMKIRMADGNEYEEKIIIQ